MKKTWTRPRRTSMSAITMASAAAYRAAIERWEGEGGRALAPDEPLSARADDPTRWGPDDETSSGDRSQAPRVERR